MELPQEVTLRLGEVTILLTLAALIQGLDSAFNLMDRWRKGKDRTEPEKPGRKPIWRFPGTRFRLTKKQVRLTQSRMSFISGAMVIWLMLLVHVYPLYQYFSPLSMFERVVWVVAYTVVVAFVPFMIGTTDLRLVFATFLFPTLEMGLAMLVFLSPGLAESSWYPTFFSIFHGVCSVGFRISLIIYFMLAVYGPWYDSLPEE